MKRDLLRNLPPEIITNIPVKTIASSKCVSKPWRHLLDTDYFVSSHLAKSAPSLAVWNSDRPLSCCQVFEFEDDVEKGDFPGNQVTKFDFPDTRRASIVGGVNGLLILSQHFSLRDTLYICNPITRLYVDISAPKELSARGPCGLGVSRVSGQYKVVRISHRPKIWVYTLGTRLWRHIAVEAAMCSHHLRDTLYICNPITRLYSSLFSDLEDEFFSAFADGNLHWAVRQWSSMDSPPSPALIVCFDLETECFSSFHAPASHGILSVLRDCLCFCEWNDEKIVVWLMKEYGVEKSWSKEYDTSQGPHLFDVYYDIRQILPIKVYYPVKVFENGDMLMLWDHQFLVYYSNKTKTFQDYGIFDVRRRDISSLPFTPSFLSLRGLGMENVISF